MEDNKVPILIVGANAEGRIVLDIANSLDVLVYGFLTDDEELLLKELNDMLVVAQLNTPDGEALLADEHVKVVLAEPAIAKRKELVSYLKGFPAELINAIDPSSRISPFAKLGRGMLISSGVIIQANAMVGSFNQIDAYTTISPDTIIGDYCTIQSGVRIGAEVQIADEVFIGAGAIIQKGVHIGGGSIIGAGSVVLQDVEPETTMFGNPARDMKA